MYDDIILAYVRCVKKGEGAHLWGQSPHIKPRKMQLWQGEGGPTEALICDFPGSEGLTIIGRTIKFSFFSSLQNIRGGGGASGPVEPPHGSEPVLVNRVM